MRISVKQDGQDTVDRQDLSLSGVISSGDVTVTSGNRRSPRGGITVTGDDEGNSVSIRALDLNNDEIDNNLFTVTTLDGQPAYIQTGQSVPIPSQNTIVTHNGVIVQDTLEYRDVTSGFYVLPRLTGDSVTLLIAPQLSKVNQGNNLSFDIQQVETTVNGKLGQWMEIGGIDQSSQDNRSIILGSSKRTRQERHTVLIKVDEIK